MAIDPLAVSNHPQCPNAHGDLLQKQWLDRIMDLIVAGLVMGGFGSPPCSTVSAARHVPLTATCRGPGPRPLRARSQPWVCLPNRTLKEQHAVEIGSCLFLLVLGFLGEIAARGGWVLSTQLIVDVNHIHHSLLRKKQDCCVVASTFAMRSSINVCMGRSQRNLLASFFLVLVRPWWFLVPTEESIPCC